MLAKRIFDMVCAFAALMVLAPLFVLVALLIKLDSRGPVFFRQERVGKGGKVFRIFKFRTVRVNAESTGQITVGRDSRITRIGHTLRHFKIDELPQIINVLYGDMSLVGPRPEVPRYVALYPPQLRDAVLSVRPGITDWASIEFKEENVLLASAKDPERMYVEQIMPVKLSYYARYVKERSFRMDLLIIFATIAAIAGLRRDIASRLSH